MKTQPATKITAPELSLAEIRMHIMQRVLADLPLQYDAAIAAEVNRALNHAINDVVDQISRNPERVHEAIAHVSSEVSGKLRRMRWRTQENRSKYHQAIQAFTEDFSVMSVSDYQMSKQLSALKGQALSDADHAHIEATLAAMFDQHRLPPNAMIAMKEGVQVLQIKLPHGGREVAIPLDEIRLLSVRHIGNGYFTVVEKTGIHEILRSAEEQERAGKPERSLGFTTRRVTMHYQEIEEIAGEEFTHAREMAVHLGEERDLTRRLWQRERAEQAQAMLLNGAMLMLAVKLLPELKESLEEPQQEETPPQPTIPISYDPQQGEGNARLKPSDIPGFELAPYARPQERAAL